MNQLDEAQLRAEMRALYRDAGDTEALACLLELLLSVNILLEIINEEREEAEGLES